MEEENYYAHKQALFMRQTAYSVTEPSKFPFSTLVMFNTVDIVRCLDQH